MSKDMEIFYKKALKKILNFKASELSTYENKKKIDDAFFKLGNYFKTKEEAEKVKEELDEFWEKIRNGEIGE